ncbi:MAG: proteasome accessory factor PafA2 [Actinomycetia bacterium]|nr:proteasome accessory factor PafA2 [Actinomycetes bacterium]MCP5033467.1 proteasome accessory factor PafA2 [Actinomycetes bacterium]
MATHKIVGIETEFGIMVRGTMDWNPVSASSLLINAYVGTDVGSIDDRATPIAWDFIDEMPGADARDFMPPELAMPPEVETHLVNAVLTNGARYYVDHAHPELSTPECRDALSVVLFDRAAELILIESMRAAAEALPPGQEIVIYKDNSDRKGNAYGCHENYLLDRNLPFGQIITAATTHFVTRQIFTGSGKVGSELPGVSRADVPYQLTQRAEHFEEEVGLETTLKRPIVNTRDEPHADSQKYRRLHVIVGDANMSQVATLLKVGTSAIVFAMLEDGALEQRPIEDPVPSMHQVSHDLTLAKPLTMADGATATALEVQWDLLDQAKSWADRHGLEAVGEDCGKLVLERWEEVLSGLESDPASLAGQVDWIAKKRILEGFMNRHDCDWDDSRLGALDLQYHDLRPGKSLAAKAGLEALVSDSDAEIAVNEPPTDTRAYFRGKCLQKFADHVVAANWDSIVFDVGDDPLRRVPMLEPGRGTVEHVGSLLEESETVSELLDRLGA